MKLRHILNLPLMLVLVIACEKEGKPCGFLQEWVQCRQGNDLDAEETFNQLIGEWKMIDSGCQNFDSPKESASERNIRIVFNADSTLQVMEDGQEIRNSKFSIILTQYNEKQVETEPLPDNLYTWGTIEFCEDKVGFISSYRDGPDYFFERIEKCE